MLLERDAELAAVGTALDRALAGSGSLLLIEGPAGIGKTALLDHARQLALERGMRVQVARGGTLERDLAHGVARQFLEPPIRAASEQQRAALLSGAAALATPGRAARDQRAGGRDRRRPSRAGRARPVLAHREPGRGGAAAARRRRRAVVRPRLAALPHLPGPAAGRAARGRHRLGTGPARSRTRIARSPSWPAGPSTRVLRPAPLSECGGRGDGAREPARGAGCRPSPARAARPPAGSRSCSRSCSTRWPAAGSRRRRRARRRSPRSRRAPSRTPRCCAWRACRRRRCRWRVASPSSAGTPPCAGSPAWPGSTRPAVLRSCDALAEAHILRVRARRCASSIRSCWRRSTTSCRPASGRCMHAAAAQLLVAEGEPDEEVAAHLLATAPGHEP